VSTFVFISGHLLSFIDKHYTAKMDCENYTKINKLIDDIN